jgi:protein SCO1
MLLTRRIAYASLVVAFLMLAGTLWMAALYPAPEAGLRGEFTLTTHEGKPFTQKDLVGREHLLFFGFTHCPDICPTTLTELTAQKVKPRILFVTIDPERDTSEQLKLYLSSFDPAIIGLTGTQLQIDHIVKIYHAYAKRIDDAKGGYTMDHSTTIYKLQKDGGFLSTFKLK